MDLVFDNPADWMKEHDTEFGWFKYVRFADGVIRFTDAAGFLSAGNHADIANTRPGIPPAFAGCIRVKNGKWYLENRGSTTLKIPAGESDEKLLARVLEPRGLVHDDEVRWE